MTRERLMLAGLIAFVFAGVLIARASGCGTMPENAADAALEQIQTDATEAFTEAFSDVEAKVDTASTIAENTREFVSQEVAAMRESRRLSALNQMQRQADFEAELEARYRLSGAPGQLAFGRAPASYYTACATYKASTNQRGSC